MRQSTKACVTVGRVGSFGGVLLVILGGSAAFAVGEEFQPIKEAEMPEGFPDPTPVGQIELKQYPAYRRATTSGLGEFWTLFRHIRQNNIAMTAPVEMDFGLPSANRNVKRSMSFLYEHPEQGEAGRQSGVEVVDVEPALVVSIGCRGQQTAAAVVEARDRLLKWLDDNEAYAPMGPLRVMGYNSPFVPRNQNFFEVQIPVELATPDES